MILVYCDIILLYLYIDIQKKYLPKSFGKIPLLFL